jgi:hypothetical protein
MGMDNGKTSLPLAEAAKQMGIPKEALRKRVLRKSIQAYKDGDGRWFVILDGSLPEPPQESPRVSPPDLPESSAFNTRHPADQELISTLQSENARLWEQIQVKDQALAEKDEQIWAWIDEAKRKDMLLAHLQERIVDLPSGAPGAPQDAPEPPQVITQMYHVPKAGTAAVVDILEETVARCSSYRTRKGTWPR